MCEHARPVAVDLFCGAGGLAYGLQKSGVQIAAGIDIDPACKYPFSQNVRAEFHQLDATDVGSEVIGSFFPQGRTRILAGCAPCQPYSAYSKKHAAHDERWRLVETFGRLVRDIQPEIVTMENVPSLLRHDVFQEFLQTLKDAGYREPYHQVLRCADYGVPQSRRRLVVLASRLGDITMVPSTVPDSASLTVRAAIGHLFPIKAGKAAPHDPLHKAKNLSETNLSRIRSSTPGGSWRDWEPHLQAECHQRESGQSYGSVYGRMEWDSLAPTLTTQFAGFGNGRFGHPEQDRAISLREGAILQTFPRQYSFVARGSRVNISQIARLIGNAVPVKFGQAIGRSIMAHLVQVAENQKEAQL